MDLEFWGDNGIYRIKENGKYEMRKYHYLEFLSVEVNNINATLGSNDTEHNADC